MEIYDLISALVTHNHEKAPVVRFHAVLDQKPRNNLLSKKKSIVTVPHPISLRRGINSLEWARVIQFGWVSTRLTPIHSSY
ncbi:hypothetical protein PAPYR_793 [Paratrimastix pyriformis]|uniref:Uncharacterized protein n=1 Tax=Paratrimastix pyriformis TaxID=342808 RepID=A0ABQ8UWC9_9EUKA|nr:hypothetical protein PAPYR_793 [Paratrimastix pyriformis]